MNYKEHSIGGIIAATGTVVALNKLNINIIELQPLYFFGGALVGSLLPDIDHPKSYLGKWFLLSGILYSTFGHRTFTHSIFFTIIMGLALGLFNISLGFGVAIGILSHILLDMFTARGVALLYPFNKRKYKIFNIK